ncbi:MAG: GNAT family N-acetyltransferase [Gammaproteobacteria bacterium]
MHVRAYHDADLAALVGVFTASVHGLGALHYTQEQCSAWAPQAADVDAWRQRLDPLETRLAIVGDTLAGFISWTADGQIEFLYVAPGSTLLQHAESALVAQGIHTFSTAASLVAQPFFARHGFHIFEEQRVERRGVTFLRYAMQKTRA